MSHELWLLFSTYEYETFSDNILHQIDKNSKLT